MREKVEALEHHADLRALGSDLLIRQVVIDAGIRILSVTQKLTINQDFPGRYRFQLV